MSKVKLEFGVSQKGFIGLTQSTSYFQQMSHDMTKTNKMSVCLAKTDQSRRVPIEDSDQPVHPPRLIRVFAVRSMDS